MGPLFSLTFEKPNSYSRLPELPALPKIAGIEKPNNT
jgi:hypothetical protein